MQTFNNTAELFLLQCSSKKHDSKQMLDLKWAAKYLMLLGTQLMHWQTWRIWAMPLLQMHSFHLMEDRSTIYNDLGDESNNICMLTISLLASDHD